MAKQERWKRKLFEDDDEEPPTTYPSRSASKTKSLVNGVRKTSALPGRKGSTPPAVGRFANVNSKKPPAELKGRAALLAGYNHTEFIPLNQEKRDRRTIEEIERDMKARQRGITGGSDLSRQFSQSNIGGSQSSSTSSSFKVPCPATTTTNGLAGLSFKPKSAAPKSIPEPQKSRPADTSYKKKAPIPVSPPAKKRRIAQEDEDDGGYRPGMFYKLMGRDLERDRDREYASSEGYDSADDMEAGAHDLEMEERRAEMISKREDREEEAREAKRKMEKQKRLAAIRK